MAKYFGRHDATDGLAELLGTDLQLAYLGQLQADSCTHPGAAEMEVLLLVRWVEKSIKLPAAAKMSTFKPPVPEVTNVQLLDLKNIAVDPTIGWGGWEC